MRKFSIFILMVSDLWAVGPEKVFELARCENPTEQQLKTMYDAWDKCLEDRRKWCDIADEEYKKDPCSEEYKKACKKSEELNIELQTYLYNELTVISRNIFSEEESIVNNIRHSFSIKGKTSVYNVRVIDAESYINGLYLSRAEKNYFLKALTSDEELLRQIDIFCKNHRFVDMSSQLLNNFDSGSAEVPGDLKNNPVLKYSVRSHLFDDSKKSRVYREAMVSYLAKECAFDFVSDHYCAPNKFKDKLIVRDTEGKFNFLGVLCYQYTFGYVNSLFRSVNSIPGSNAPWQFILDPKLIFFHEVGHARDFFTTSLSWMGMDQTAKILPKLIKIGADTDVFDQIRPVLLEGLNRDVETLQYLKGKLKTKETDFNKILDLLRLNLTNPVFMSEFSLDNSCEVWQILGVFFSSFNGRRNTFIDTLYINKMSDFSLSCDLGLPVRCDHLGFIETSDTTIELDNDRKEKRKFMKNKLEEMLEYDLPLEAYGALMEFYGTSMQAYVLRLMYPYGLISQLQTEYRLNSNLEGFKQIYKQTLQ